VTVAERYSSEDAVPASGLLRRLFLFARVVLAGTAFLGAWIGAGILAMVLFPVSRLRHRRQPTIERAAACQRWMQRAFVLLFDYIRLCGLLHFNPRGLDTSTPARGFVIVANHPTLIDIAAVSAVFGQGRLPVPVLTLNQPEHGEVPPPGSAAFGLSPDTEAAQAAEHMLELGIKSAVIITATDDWAERAALAFRAQLENHNGEIVGDARVKDGEINYSSAIRQALNAVPATGAAPSLPGAAPNPAAAATAPPALGIFISMRPQQARLLLPQVRLAGYTGVPVFATSHVYSGNADPGQDRDLDGVEFCDAPWLFDLTPGAPHYGDITRQLESARGAGARLFALGLDAYALLPYMDWLAQHHDAYLPGATGQLSEDELERVQRLLVWARFDGGIARPINGSLQVTPAAP